MVVGALPTLVERATEGALMTHKYALRAASVIGTVVALAAIVGAGTKWW